MEPSPNTPIETNKALAVKLLRVTRPIYRSWMCRMSRMSRMSRLHTNDTSDRLSQLFVSLHLGSIRNRGNTWSPNVRCATRHGRELSDSGCARQDDLGWSHRRDRNHKVQLLVLGRCHGPE